MRNFHQLTALLLSLLFVGISSAFSQDISTQGTEFWVSFMGNGYEEHGSSGAPAFTPYLTTQLMISSKQDCSGTVTNPITNWTKHFNVAANNITFVDIPKEQGYVELTEYSQAVNRGLFVESTAPVSVYCANVARNSFDASYVLPVEAIANDYIIQTYDQSTGIGTFGQYYTSAFLIVATEEGLTNVDITPTVRTLDGYSANFPFSITLRKGEAYQVRSHNSTGSRDLSGSRVTARDGKKIAVFNGNTLTKIPSGDDSDCVFEQAMPLQAWGKKFVVTASLGREANDYVKITSAYDNNVILKNGQNLCTLNANESTYFELGNSEKSCFIQASSSCAVYLYNHSKDESATSNIGAPSMVWISPIEQRIDELTFSTFNDDAQYHVNVDNHYVNIIVKSEDAGDVTLDGALIAANLFETVHGTSEYKFYRKEIDHGVHHLSCPNGFNAHVYGFGVATGYAYMAGSNAADLSTTLFVDDVIVNQDDIVVHCDTDALTFVAEINYPDYFDVLWDFGDGSTSTSTTATHAYQGTDVYEVTFSFKVQEAPDSNPITITTVFYVDTRSDQDVQYYDTICFRAPDTYTEHGFNLYYDHSGDTFTDSYTVTNQNGCQSLHTLYLTVNGLSDLTAEHENRCDSMVWHGKTYYETGHYTDTVPDDDCFTVHHLDLTIYNFTPSPSSIKPIGQSTVPFVVPATDFQINSYTFAINDTRPQCVWDSVSWHFCKRATLGGSLIDCDSEINWKKIEKGVLHDTCKIYVLSYMEDTIWLRATVYNDCKPEGVSSDYWLVCSYYDIDEHETEPFGFNVVPNPNQGQMELHFDKLNHPADIKVYDMRGLLVDQFKIHNESSHNMLSYDMSRHGGGIYFFVATTKEGTVARKVVVQ